MINAKQCRAARAWLSWSQQELADKSLVSKRAIANFESDHTVPHDRTIRDLQRTFEDEGLTFQFDGARGIGVQESQDMRILDLKALSET